MEKIVVSAGLEDAKSFAIKDQLVRIRLPLVIGFTAAFMGIYGAYLIGIVSGTPLSHLTRDPSAVTSSPFYIGMLSTLGIMLWAGTTAICFFGAAILRGIKHCHHFNVFILISGIISLLLMLDDAFLIHEKVMPQYFDFSEKGVFLGYFIIVGGYLVYYSRRILKTDYLLLIIALLFLGLSVLMDRMFSFSNMVTFIEDSLKFVGIVFWFAYFCRVTLITVYDSFGGDSNRV